MGDLFILVVSNDSNFRDYLANYLLMDGHYVDIADQSNMARQMLNRMNYDLVLMSLTGFKNIEDVLTAEEVHELNPDSEIIFLFNPNSEIDKQFMPCRKADTCLLHPFILQDLPAVLAKIAQKKGTGASLKGIQKKAMERRGTFRVKVEIPIKYTFILPLGNLPSEENLSKIVNISQDGVMFKADLKSKMSEFVYLYMLLPTTSIPINIEGEIRWERFNSMEPWRYVGVRFSNISQENRKQIIQFIGLRQCPDINRPLNIL